jgi:hypothetical protein
MSSSKAADSAPRRDLRDRPIGRIAILVVVLAVALVASKSCAGGDQDVTQDEAVATALEVARFKPDDWQVRFLRQGLPSRGYWIVSMYQGTYREPTRIQLVTIDATTGEITEEDVG